MDKRLYLDVNRFAGQSAWLHDVARFLTGPGGLILLAALLLAAYLQARSGGLGGSDLDQVAAVVWSALAAAISLGIALVLVTLVGRSRPFMEVSGALVIVARPSSHSFPSVHAAVAGAVAAGLWCARTRLVALLATLLALAIALAEVYVGVAWPSDAASGLLIGAAVALVGYPVAIGPLRILTHSLARSPGRLLVGGHGGRLTGPGPAARPAPLGTSGSVRVLRDDPPGAAGGS